MTVVVHADPPTDGTLVGDVVTDPLTGTDSTVTGLLQDDNDITYAVTTDAERMIYTTTNVDDVFPDDNGDWTITSVTNDGYNGAVDTISMERQVPDPNDPNATITESQTLVVADNYDTSNPVDADGNPINPEGNPGTPETITTTPPDSAAGDRNRVYIKHVGHNGDDGRDGYGVKVCIPATDICKTVAYDPKPGKPGLKPTKDINKSVSQSDGPIESTRDKRAGITALSRGGDGGQGGDAYGNIPAEHGGRAGDGGDISLSTDTVITTTGSRGHGVFAQSRAGRAGDGGTGYLWSEGGAGGGPAQGGTVYVTNNEHGRIGTTGYRAYGIFAQSIGGSAANGGDSWGFVGRGGSSNVAGAGGDVHVTHRGRITTAGTVAHGIFAQSIGGTGGDGGSGGGILGDGGNGSLGGDGGYVTVVTDAGSVVETTGRGALGIFAQSIGGGGGNGGVGAGIVGLGGSGSGGGDGDRVTVTNNGAIVTHNEGAFGILAQSIGGGGGNGGVGAGIVGLGGSGSGGGDGDRVTVSSTSSQSAVTTWGAWSHGILAQSIGGGGGTGGISGGVVAIGGSGGSGGDGGTVTVNSRTAIRTHGLYSKGLYVQSIGGGGGAGSGSGGAVSIGGDGSGGGDGGRVSVTNRGNITTGYHFDANGHVTSVSDGGDALFIQSIGGGGGSGGGSGGVVSIGGDGSVGGDGGRITVFNEGDITTGGNLSRGVLVQSIGGGGGAGAGSGGAVSIGGEGSIGGDGGNVTVTNEGDITTGIYVDTNGQIVLAGTGSSGLFVQSIGGGGGSGAGSGGAVSLGGEGGAAGEGGSVHLDNRGNIATGGEAARGVFAQSIGGGGGSGAGSGGAVSIGGRGSGGGDGGELSVTNRGYITTFGLNSDGIFAQSVGGGGGDGAGSGSGGVVSIGGNSGGSGEAGSVTVVQGDGAMAGGISTQGRYADAIFAQSVGGGGGDGAGSGGVLSIGGSGSGGADAARVRVTNYDTLQSSGDESRGIFAQSVGGGGGNGAGGGGLIAIGGSGSGAGNGGRVDVINAGMINTSGELSSAIFAQSVGGGGGNGGTAGGTFITIGGHGGGGADAEMVTVTNSNNIFTSGNESDGIFAQSIGGGGGNGGGAASGSAFAGLAIGSTGGNGGDAEEISVTVTGHSVAGQQADTVIRTRGDRSRGIFAQSIGGGGGNGGFAVQGAVGTFGSVSVTVGGSGGSGGDAEKVTAQVEAQIDTSGEDAAGLVAQSIGGGGGNGGFAVAGAIQFNPVGGAALAVGVGGSGGNGGRSDSVEADLTGSIVTRGDKATGLLAQSVGGGGGNGGFSVTSSLSGGGAGSGAISVGVGGSGGSGGRGDEVSSTVNGDIFTFGDDADALIAQSIGGGGGNGGFTVASTLSGAGIISGAVTAGVGGSGGDGGNGDTVNAHVRGNIQTMGNRSGGLLAQSVGGGGGNGGFNISSAGSGAVGGSGAISVGVGGSGATGGDGGAVYGSMIGNTTTSGSKADALVFQSIGGGGGNGGFDISGAISGAGGGSGSIAVGIGGAGAGGGSGDTVDADVQGNVLTRGNGADGILVQSVGGAGGNGGFDITGVISGAGVGSGGVAVGIGGAGGSGGEAGAVTSNISGEYVDTAGSKATGIIVQSVGGGGGNGGFDITGAISGAGTGSGAVSVGIGGSGGAGGAAGTVQASVASNVITHADKSDGVVVQSVGGGGGNGGFNIDGAISGAGAGSGAVSVGIGGTGGGGGNADDVTAAMTGRLETLGEDSQGIVVQSLGGGGGNGGFNIDGTISGAGTGSGAVSVGIGGSGGIGGDAGTVQAGIVSNAFTHADSSSGVLIQSLGGGGGNGGFNIDGAVSGSGAGSGAVSVGIGGSGGGGGNADDVTASMTGNLETIGKDSHGILVQSVGGGGGNGAFNIDGAVSGASTGSGAVSVGLGGFGGLGGNSGVADLDMIGLSITHGDDADAVVVQSIGGGGGNGGFNIDGAISGATTGSGAVSVGIGGAGGGGGSSSSVAAVVHGNLLTEGKDSQAMLAQSVGGGGGNGGVDVTGSVSLSSTSGGSVSVGLGGFGGDGGDAGSVSAYLEGIVQTFGEQGGGMLAQSLGGGGGNGATNVSGAVNVVGSGTGAAVGLGLGGFGGSGGDAANVTLVRQGDSQTSHDKAVAVAAQSIGGGGGNGGVNVTGAASLALQGSGAAIGVGIGGFGGGGGQAGNVDASVTGLVVTGDDAADTGRDSVGVLAQSIGGSGGNGGINVSGGLSAALNGTSAAVGFGLGGFGGAGGDSGSTDLRVTGDVATYGANAHGVMAQSIAGGGGNGGLNVSGGVAVTNIGRSYSAGIGIGGFGGNGGDSGDVDVTVTGDVLAHGLGRDEAITVPDMVVDGITIPNTGYSKHVVEDGSHGIVAQSIGGGGGNGGININGGISVANPTTGRTGSLVLGMGGFGGGGGSAGDVQATVNGDLITAIGDERISILAQSLGGGGGNGGLNISGGIVMDGPLLVGVGGLGGDGGTGGDVTVNAHTAVQAEGRDGVGILAQSLGGGGGNGGINISGSVAASKRGTLPSVTIGVGGFGGTGAVSGDVQVDQEGTILTSGESGHGLLAQSIGGGGGNGGINITSSINHTPATATAKPTDLSMVLGIGGHAGDGADAGNVQVASKGEITAHGDFARGLFAQSVGGGGGTGGLNVSSVVATQGTPVVVGIGGFGSGGGDAGTVTVDRGDEESEAGTIHTSGRMAVGLEASSIGGGGGDAGMNFLLSYGGGGSSGTSGNTGSNPWQGKVDDSVITNYDRVIAELNGNNGTGNSSNAYSVQLAIGGAAGDAGHGNNVSVHDYSEISTHGTNSYGLLAQSIGGGGGNATFNIGVGYAPNSRSAKIALGGTTGEGGNGGQVTVDHGGNISTTGWNAAAVIAQSIGGGGGNAGMDFVYNKTSAGSVGLTIGRHGGTGGRGGTVDLASNGDIETSGKNAYGLLAQSVGNGGGNSSATSVGVTGAETASGESTAALAIGLEGGIGGEGGDVSIDSAGTVITLGEKAHAIFAQSVGGGGGNGGAANTAGLTAPVLGVSVGGTGGQGATGGNVSVANEADVQTEGNKAIAILAQSIGGGGGTGGRAQSGGAKISGGGVQVTVGGSGGTGADAGMITVSNSGHITTGGNAQGEVNKSQAHGIVAQSIGGGGGDGGLVINGLSNTSTANSSRLFMSIGGDGGTGGIGANVDVENDGSIITHYENSVGILAQSIGGGGGAGSTVVTESFTSASGGATVGLGIGGTGGTGGTAGDVTVSNLVAGDSENSGLIETIGTGAHGIYALSLGGGGGSGSTVITSTVSKQFGASVPSTAIQMNIGGDGGTGGAAGAVRAINEGTIHTHGDEAHGIVAESIGGGGGDGGLSVNGNLLLGSQASSGINSAIGIGGDGGNGNTGSTVQVDNTGLIETDGAKSYGIFAQSIGGGGGNSGTTVAVSLDPTVTSGVLTQSSVLSVGIGGTGGDGANAGDVTVNHTGSIITHGADSYAIFAQSIGGGGGTSSVVYTSPFWMAGDFVYSSVLGGKNTADGIAGRVIVNSEGDIHTDADCGPGIFAQSINGGGGNAVTYLDVSEGVTSLGQEVVDIEEVTSLVEDAIALVHGVYDLGAEYVHDMMGGYVESQHEGNVATLGSCSSGLTTQSVGGGGGSSKVRLSGREQDRFDLDIGLGAQHSSANPGGDIHSERAGSVFTAGANAVGYEVQSVGGGGGSLDLGLVGSEGGHASATSVRMGGIGGDANSGGNIALSLSGDMHSMGARSQGLLVQSIGAGGGELRLTGTGGAEVLLGGGQGATGDGGSLDINNQGVIVSEGALAHALFLQSVGGGGGALFTDLAGNALTLTLSDEGHGSGGSIRLVQAGSLATHGEDAFAAFVQSVGGGGGVVDNIFAGTAGGVGNAGALDLNITGDLYTMGAGARGLYAQSAAGVGSGGPVHAAITGLTRTEGINADAIHVFSSGSLGAGDVLVSTGNVVTLGDRSRGIYAESDAGQGMGGAIVVNTIGGVWTTGQDAQGIFVTSRGNSGGGSLTVTGSGGVQTSGARATAVFARSNGGDNSGASVTVALADAVGTAGNEAPGIYAQSMGNTAASTVQVAATGVTTIGDASPAILARSNGGDGPGDAVSVATSGIVNTWGTESMGIIAQSMGHGDGGRVSVLHGSDLSTAGRNAVGILAQSIGGEGGNLTVVPRAGTINPLFKAAPVSVHLGNTGGGVENGGLVELTMNGDLSTRGDCAQGLLAQSIGAGGGMARISGPGSVDVMLGAVQGGSGNGGTITVDHSGSIFTSGTLSHGIFLQSIGGGGGAVFSDQSGADINILANHEGIGSGGAINLIQNGPVVTRGTGAHGAFLQSIGGGGGAVDDIFSGSSGGIGNGGAINAVFMDDVAATGRDGVAIYLQSAAGTGSGGSIELQVNGNVLASGPGGTAIHAESSGSLGGGDITIDLNGGLVLGGRGGRGVEIIGGHNNVLTNRAVIRTEDGVNGMAIFATSGNDTVYNHNTVIGSVDLGSGRNSFYNLRGAWLLSGPLLAVGHGNLVINEGYLSPGGSGRFMTTNLIGNFVQTSSGTYLADLDFYHDRADQIRVSGSARVSGTVRLSTMHPEELLPGIHEVRLVTTGSGLTSSGVYLDVRPSAVVDYRLKTLDQKSLALIYDVDFSPLGLGGDGMSGDNGLSANMIAIGDYFNALQLAGGRDVMDPYIRYLFYLTDSSELADVYGPLVPDFYDNFTRTTQRIMRQFLEPISLRMHAVFDSGREKSGQPWARNFSFAAPVRLAYNGSNADLARLLSRPDISKKRYGTWINITGFRGKQDPVDAYASYDYRAKSVIGGLDYRWNDTFLVGLALGHTWTSVDVDDQGQGDIGSTYGTLYGGFFPDPWYVNASISYGHHDYDTYRHFVAFSVPTQTRSNHQGHSWSLHGEGGYAFHIFNWLLQPFAGLSYQYLDESGFRTSGADALDLVMQDRDTRSLSSELGTRLGRGFFTPLGLFTPELSVSWNYDFGIDDRTLRSSFAGFQDASFPTICRENARSMVKVGAGLTFQGAFGFSSSLRYIGGWENGYKSHGVIGELRIEF